MKLLDKITTYKKLGLGKLFHVVFYRLALKFGYFEKKLPIKPIFNDEKNTIFFTKEPLSNDNNSISSINIKAFGWLNINADSPPNWHKAVNSDEVIANNESHWSKLNDFDQNVGDIKTVW